MAQAAVRETRDTKERILDAATRLFADQGFDATSLRGITSDAGVNLAAVNYHFGSKEALAQAVFERLLSPINEARLEQLDAVEAAGASGGPSIEQIAEAFIAPALRMTWGDRGRPIKRLFAHTIGHPNPQIRQAILQQFAEILARFSQSIQQALPELTDDETRWRILFMAGATVHTMVMSDDMSMCGGTAAPSADDLVQRLVPFVAAGMRSAAAGGA